MPECTCEIRWIDRVGEPTPDNNKAVKQVRCNFSALPEPRPEPSEWSFICEEHLKRMPSDGSWEARDLPERKNYRIEVHVNCTEEEANRMADKASEVLDNIVDCAVVLMDADSGEEVESIEPTWIG